MSSIHFKTHQMIQMKFMVLKNASVLEKFCQLGRAAMPQSSSEVAPVMTSSNLKQETKCNLYIPQTHAIFALECLRLARWKSLNLQFKVIFANRNDITHFCVHIFLCRI